MLNEQYKMSAYANLLNFIHNAPIYDNKTRFRLLNKTALVVALWKLLPLKVILQNQISQKNRIDLVRAILSAKITNAPYTTTESPVVECLAEISRNEYKYGDGGKFKSVSISTPSIQYKT